MQIPTWETFIYKSNGNLNSAFENLSRILFCERFGKKLGIFQRINQKGNEAEAISVGNDIIGFQAKFFAHTINEADIIDSIKKAHEANPKQNIIYLYINLGFGNPKKGAHKTSKEIKIEESASKYSMKIEWVVDSMILDQVAREQWIREMFFDVGPNMVTLVAEEQRHCEVILNAIRSQIDYCGQEIKFDRTEQIHLVETYLEEESHIVIFGEGGCGKTAIVKDLYDKLHANIPICIRKAQELNVNNLADIFKRDNQYTFDQFLNAYANDDKKIFILDSAERLQEIEDDTNVKYLLQKLNEHKWTIIFTVRSVYVDDLRSDLLYSHHFDCKSVAIDNISTSSLTECASKYHLLLPTNEKFKDRLCNLFYLNLYVELYDENNIDETYNCFIKKAWREKIEGKINKAGINLKRTKNFVDIVRARNATGQFYLRLDKFEADASQALISDEIIAIDENHGLFITHDIYEEWGLNRILNDEWQHKESILDFFDKIGSSLLIRRAFRLWLSDKIEDSLSDVEELTKYIFSSEIESFWKDEIIVSILLSDYVETFFETNTDRLIENDAMLLNRITFLLRIACKYIDGHFSFEGNEFPILKPKGRGWNAAINLIYHSRNENIPIYGRSQIVKEWCEYCHVGATTRQAGLIALSVFQGQEKEHYRISENLEGESIQTICNAAQEIKLELRDVFTKVRSNGWTKYGTPYFSICTYILTKSLPAFNLIAAVPREVIAITDLFWSKTKITDEEEDSVMHVGLDDSYGLNEDFTHNDYYPASALQTPIYYLLTIDLYNTLDFIIRFTNRTVDCYQKSKYGKKDTQKVTINLMDSESITQYLSSALWCTYRGMGSPVVPYRVQSIHMALEKFLLEAADRYETDVIESILQSILAKSTSASLTAVVSSIVLAHPNKFWKTALILFKTIEFFHIDSVRCMNEFQVKSLYELSYSLNKHLTEERLKTCSDQHRESCLETLIVNYQLFGVNGFSDEENKVFIDSIYAVIDWHRDQSKSLRGESRTIRGIFLSRIDRRLFRPEIKKKDESRYEIELNPELTPDLAMYSQQAMQAHQDSTKYITLGLWGRYKDEDDSRASTLLQYDENPQSVMQEMRQLIEDIKINSSKLLPMDDDLPNLISAVLVRYYFGSLNKQDLDFCKDIITNCIALSLKDNYSSHIGDGLKSCVKALPRLIMLYPNEDYYQQQFLFILFNDNIVGADRTCDYVIKTISHEKLWENDEQFMSSLVSLYIQTSILYKKYKKASSERYRSMKRYGYSKEEVLDKIRIDLKDLEPDLNKLNLDVLNSLSIDNIEVLFQLIPDNTRSPRLLAIVNHILPSISQLLNKKDRYDNLHVQRLLSFRKYANFILNRDVAEINSYLLPILINIDGGRECETFISELISAEDILRQKEQFWEVWRLLYDPIINMQGFYKQDIFTVYLLAWQWWKDNITEWHSLTSDNLWLYANAAKDIGGNPTVLYSISKVLNSIGSSFLEEGIDWISTIIISHSQMKLGGFEEPTLVYMERVLRKYITDRKMLIRKNARLKNKLIPILTFMIERGSVQGYILRESIL